MLFVSAALFVLPNALAESQLAVRIRGDITSFDGHQVQIKSRENLDLNVSVTDDTKISILYPLKLGDIKKGSFVGVTAIQHGPGTPLQAREVHIFRKEQRGTGEGHYPWDLEPGASMTNANVDAIVSTNNGKVLTLSYKGGSQKVIVTKGVPVIGFKPADKSLLKTGAHVFCIAMQSADGSLAARYISVGKDGMKPPM